MKLKPRSYTRNTESELIPVFKPVAVPFSQVRESISVGPIDLLELIQGLSQSVVATYTGNNYRSYQVKIERDNNGNIVVSGIQDS